MYMPDHYFSLCFFSSGLILYLIGIRQLCR